MKTYSISEVAEQFDLQPHTLRFYEREGIITPERAANGIRQYTEANVAQMKMVLCLKDTGMSIKDIRRYFQLVTEGDDTLTERLEILVQQREQVLREIDELKEHLEMIERKVGIYQERIAEQTAVASIAKK